MIPGSTNPRYILFLLIAILAVNQMDRTIISILLDDISKEFALTNTQLGLLSGGVLIVAYSLFGFPIAKLSARSSRKNIIGIATAIWSLLTFFVAGAQNFWQLMLARIGVGIGESGAVVPTHSIISDMFPPERRTSAMASYVVGANLGVLLAFLVGGFAGQLLGWRWAFVIAAVPGLLLALVFFFTVKEPPRAPNVSDEIDNLFLRTLGVIWQDQGLRHALVGVSLASILTHAGLAWNATYIIRAHELSLIQTGIFFALSAGILGSLVTFGSGWLADHFGTSHPRFRLGMVVAAILIGKPFSAAFAILTPTVPALMCLLVPIGLASVFWGPTFAFLHGRVAPEMRPMATAIFMFAFSIVGVGIGPTLIGVLSDTIFASEGIKSLGWAIMTVQIIGVWSAYHYWVAMKTIPDVEMVVRSETKGT